MTFLGLLAPEQGFEIRELPQLQWALPNNIKLFDVFYEDEGKLTEDEKKQVERYKPNKIEQIGPIFHNNYQFTASNIHLGPVQINKIIDDIFKNPLYMAFIHSRTDPYAKPSAYNDVADMIARINIAPRPSFMEPTPVKQKRSFKYDPNLVGRLLTEDDEDDIIWYDTVSPRKSGGYSSNQKRHRSIKRRSTKRRSNSQRTRRSKSNRRRSTKKRSAKSKKRCSVRRRSKSQRRRRS